MKRVLLIVAIIIGLSVFPGLSHAESYLSGYVGAVIPHDSDADDNTGSGIPGEMSFDSGVAVGAKLGYWFADQNAPFLGLQLDFNGNFVGTDTFTALGIVGTLDSDVTVYSLTANLLLRYPEGLFRPYIGAGGGWFWGEIDDGTLTVGGASVAFTGEDDNAFGWQVLGGIAWYITDAVSIFAEYKYSRAEFEFGGQVGVDLDYQASQIYGGVTLNF